RVAGVSSSYAQPGLEVRTNPTFASTNPTPAMLAWSPILIQKIEIQALGFVLRKLQLNRHREAEVAEHTHAYTQLILYLSGEGWQTIKGRRREAHPGDLFVIPPGVPHGFS